MIADPAKDANMLSCAESAVPLCYEVRKSTANLWIICFKVSLNLHLFKNSYISHVCQAQCLSFSLYADIKSEPKYSGRLIP